MRITIKKIEAFTQSTLLILMLAGSLLPIHSVAQASGSNDTSNAGAAVAQPGPSGGDDSSDTAVVLKDRKEKLSYALGMNLAKFLRDQSVEVDSELYVRGFQDMLAGGRMLLSESEARALAVDLQKELKKKQITGAAKTAQQAPSGRPESPHGATADPSGIEISYKLDPRLTKGLYMGERWVSAPYRQTGDRSVTVEARAHVSGAKAKPSIATWVPADSEMVKITPGEGSKVKITVLRAGESKLKVLSDELSREVIVRAKRVGNAMQVEFSQ